MDRTASKTPRLLAGAIALGLLVACTQGTPIAGTKVGKTATPAAGSADAAATPDPNAVVPGSGLNLRVADMAVNSWAPLAPMVMPRQGLVAVDLGDRLVAMTGDGSLIDEHYTYATDTWVRYRSPLVALGSNGLNVYFAGGAALGSTLALIGGIDGSESGPLAMGLAIRSTGNDPFPYQAINNLALPSAPVYAMGMTAYGGNVYVAGGRTLAGVQANACVFTSLTSTSSPDPTQAPITLTATSLPPMPIARAGLGLAGAAGKVYAIGGYSLDPQAVDTAVADNLVQVYDPLVNQWQTSADPGGPPPMPTKRYGFGVASLADRIFVVGGRDARGNTVQTVEVFDPSTRSWSTLAPMPTARSAFALVAHQGRLYALGGADATGRATRVVEAYAP